MKNADLVRIFRLNMGLSRIGQCCLGSRTSARPARVSLGGGKKSPRCVALSCYAQSKLLVSESKRGILNAILIGSLAPWLSGSQVAAEEELTPEFTSIFAAPAKPKKV
jgi:hypothetical protein